MLHMQNWCMLYAVYAVYAANNMAANTQARTAKLVANQLIGGKGVGVLGTCTAVGRAWQRRPDSGYGPPEG